MSTPAIRATEQLIEVDNDFLYLGSLQFRLAELGPCLKRLTEASALALFVARALLVDHVDATSALDDLIVRADFFN